VVLMFDRAAEVKERRRGGPIARRADVTRSRPWDTPASVLREVGNSGVATMLEGSVVQRSPGCACGGSCGECAGQDDRLRIQPSLVVGPVDDAFEQEADRVADRVVGLTAGEGLGPGADGDPPGLQRQAEAPVEEEPATNPLLEQIELLLAQEGVRAKSAGPGVAPTPALESGIARTKGGGEPLPAPVKSEMESAFGADFGAVRVHTDDRAAAMSRGINAHAFTHGNDIYFNAGAFAPSTRTGKHLLAHELTHTLQQGTDRVRRMAITRNSFTGLTCGGSITRWTFTLDNPAPSAGYFVQRIRMLRTMQDCPSDVKSISITPWLEFWEAMDVNSGDTRPSYHSAIGFSDQSGIAPEPGKSGCAAALGTIKFFPRGTTGDLGSLAVAPAAAGSAWGPGKVPMSGDLPSTPSEPSWWKNSPTEGPAQRWASSWWNCCGDPATARNVTDAHP
jgi:hypothetical protein